MELRLLDHTAGDFGSGVSGGLGAEIIRSVVDDHRPTDHIPDAKTVCQYGQICVSVALQ